MTEMERRPVPAGSSERADNTGRFTGKGEGYDRYRPDYPAELLAYLFGPATGRGDGSTVADIGAGTGLFSAQIARRCGRVVCVEPNGDMLEQARSRLAALVREGRCELVQAPAEHTGLAGASVDLVTAAQAFHWFDRAAFKAECRRILKPGGKVALVWNSRVPDAPINQACEGLNRELCPAFHGFSGGIGNDPTQFSDFFDGEIDFRAFPHDLVYDRAGFIGRNLSASYAPREGDPSYGAYVLRLGGLFDEFSRDGSVTIPNAARLYVGRV